VRTCCRSCGDELRVPFSCKSRGCCPCCMGRRMAEGAALLVDHVLPALAAAAAAGTGVLPRRQRPSTSSTRRRRRESSASIPGKSRSRARSVHPRRRQRSRSVCRSSFTPRTPLRCHTRPESSYEEGQAGCRGPSWHLSAPRRRQQCALAPAHARHFPRRHLLTCPSPRVRGNVAR
jgi:hypothetical protein